MCPKGRRRSTSGSNSTMAAGFSASSCARNSTRARSISRISFAQSSRHTIVVGIVGDNSDAVRFGAASGEIFTAFD